MFLCFRVFVCLPLGFRRVVLVSICLFVLALLHLCEQGYKDDIENVGSFVVLIHENINKKLFLDYIS